MHLFRKHRDQHHEENAPILRVENVSIAFDHPVLKDVSLEVKRGETLAVMGKSGTGKSVLLKLIVGLLPPQAGVSVVDPAASTRASAARCCFSLSGVLRKGWPRLGLK